MTEDRRGVTGRGGRAWWAVGGSVVVVAAVLVPVAAAVLATDYVSASDWASIELFTRDVFSRHPPLVGAWSRYGWSHPGPLAFMVLAIPYRLLGADGQAMQLAALITNGVAMATAAWLLYRRGVAAFLMGLLVITATAWSLPALTVADYWNVSIAVFPLLLTIIACWCALAGDRGAGMVAVVAFAFTIQAHVGLGLVVAPLGVVTVAVVVRRAMGDRPRWRAIAIGAAVGVVLAVPMIVDAIVHWPGNLWRILVWSVTNDEPTVGATRTLRIVGRATSLSFVGSPRIPAFGTVIEPVALGVAPGALVVLLGAAGILAVRRGWRSEALLIGALALTWASAVVATASIRGPLLGWLLNWIAPLVWMSWGAIGLVAYRLVPRVGVRPVAVAVGVLWLVVTVTYAADAADGEFVLADQRATIEQFTSAAIAAIEPSRPVRVAFTGDPERGGSLQAALVNQLDDHGRAPRVSPSFELQFGRHRVADRGPTLLISDEAVTRPAPAGAELLAIEDPLTPSEREEADALTNRLDALLVTVGADADTRGLLTTRFADAVLTRAPVPPEVADAAPAFHRLAALRDEPTSGRRTVLYLLP